MQYPFSSRALLAYVLREARRPLGSPEQVGRRAAVSGRTIRRLEDPDADGTRPRALTLATLAAFYGLRGGFVRELGEWNLEGGALLERLRERVAETLTPEVVDEHRGERDEAVTLAMLLARARGRERARPVADSEEPLLPAQLLDDLRALDRRRLRLVSDLAAELRAGAELRG